MAENIKIVGLIPARGGSKSIPKKNIMPLGGHPLLAYSVAIGKMSKYISEIVVTTDSDEIAAIARSYGADVPFLRPKEISGDTSLDIEFFRHYLDFVRDSGAQVPDLIVHLRPTSPLRDVAIVDQAIAYMISNPQASSLRSMQRANFTPYKVFRKEGEFAKPFLSYPAEREFYNLPRQTFEATFDPNGYVDIIRTKTLTQGPTLHGDTMKLWETDPIADIDLMDDYLNSVKLLQDNRFHTLINFMKDYNEQLSGNHLL